MAYASQIIAAKNEMGVPRIVLARPAWGSIHLALLRLGAQAHDQRDHQR